MGSVSRYSYLADHVAPYLAEEWVNGHTPSNTVIAMVQTSLAYYLDRDHLNDWYGERYARLEAGSATRLMELASWCRAGAQYAIVNRGADFTGAFGKIERPDQRWLHTPGLHATLLYSANLMDVYAITPCSALRGP